jgi:hypothetical protein
MRRFVLAVAACLAMLAAAAALPERAEALTMTAPAGLSAAIAETSVAEQVYWRRHRWHHRYWHRGWAWRWPWFGPRWHWFGPRWYGHRHWRHHRRWWR